MSVRSKYACGFLSIIIINPGLDSRGASAIKCW